MIIGVLLLTMMQDFPAYWKIERPSFGTFSKLRFERKFSPENRAGNHNFPGYDLIWDK